jgi:stage V sporulation protein S
LESPVVEILKVSSKSNPNSVAGALAGVVRGAGSVEMQVVGAGALNQAVKALAIARSYIANSGMDLACRPTFADITIDGEERTAIRLLVEKFAPRQSADGSATELAADLRVDGRRSEPDPQPGASPSVDARDPRPESAPSPHLSTQV